MLSVLWILGCVVGGLISVCFILVGSFAIYLKHHRAKYAHIPSPKCHFLLGHISQFSAIQSEGGCVIKSLVMDWLRTYGHTVVVHMLHITYVMTMDPCAIKLVLIDKNLTKPKSIYMHFWNLYGTRFVGEAGLVATIDNGKWRTNRGLMNPAFHRKILYGFLDHFNTISDSLMSQLSNVADGKTLVSLNKMMNRVTLDVIGKIAFGMDIDSITDDSSPFPAAIKLCFEGFNKQTAQIMPKPFDSYPKKVRQAVKLIRETGRKMILDRQKSIADGNAVGDDILSYIAEAPKHNPHLDIEDLLDFFVIFFVAGQETTGNTLGFIVMELGRHPDVMKKCQEEIDSVLGSKPNVTYQDLSNLPYLDMVIKETQRMYPPASATCRVVDEDVDIGGYMVPAGSSVMPLIYACQNSPDFWSDPEQFQPERFDSEHRHNPYTFCPFSLGPRNCIGQSFAKIEMKIILSKFIQKFKLELDPNQSFDIEKEMTMKPRGGVMATLTMR